MTRRLLYSKIVSAQELGKTRTVRASTPEELESKIEELRQKWQREWDREQERARVRDLKRQAEERSEDAQTRLAQYRELLVDALELNHRIQWETLYDSAPFKEPQFTEDPPSLLDIMRELNVPAESYLVELVWRSKRDHRIELESRSAQVLEERRVAHEKRREEHNKWVENLRSEHVQKQRERKLEVDRFREDYEAGTPDSVEKYIEFVLEHSSFPNDFPMDIAIQYRPGDKLLVVDFRVAHPDEVPSETLYKFIQSRKVIEPVHMKKKEFEQFYESVVHPSALRVIYTVFKSDYAMHVTTAVFNGYVEGVDRATGKDYVAFVISCQATREEFSQFDLSRVDAKETVRKLKGLVAGPLAQLAPVRPILQIERDDQRFVSAREVLEGVDSSQNLAEMPWEDFEHLVRELFGQYFASDGNEVNVTRASRDGGVDAIAFDPDPIRGGKFVIQAKRYNGLVPVSAVRDLYGTMINEGATRGILVTTSYYGNDSREFAKDKPITLIDGPNLVHMFQEHGRDVRIELKKRDIS